MKKRIGFLLLLLLLVLMGLLFLPRSLRDGEDAAESEGGILSEREIGEIEEIAIQNRYDGFSVRQEEGGFVLADLPAEQVNAEYLFMLLDESARVEYLALVSEEGKNLAPYGLDAPDAEVTVRYTDGSALSLIFGAEEPVSRGRYFMASGAGAIYLMDRSRVMRFIQPLKRFINFEIVPARGFPSPLAAIQSLRLSGEAFPRPVVISAVDAGNEEDMRIASSFGAAGHLVRSPVLHEIDQKECIEVFSSLTGLLNIEALDYNVSDEGLAAYGFDRPYVIAEFEYKQNAETAPVRIVLKAARYRGGYILVRDDQRVVHRVENKAFISTSYEKLVMRWFLTPFITDIESIRIERWRDAGPETHTIKLSGENNRSLAASLDGRPVDIDLFRKFYRLLISASNDGALLEQPAQEGEPLLALAFSYRDPQKKDDTMIFSRGSLRRLNVTVNGVTEFAALERYYTVTASALEALAEGRDFSTDW
ncbi:MAG: DUF4340 domain-containing protein [Treponema sp.]|jgi:hypothetical protein|nr:DUF4340 domain-containing protein [Treponema sp.]